MERRELLKMLTSAAALSALPGEWLLAVQQARAEAELSFGLRTLNGHQDATVKVMSELIIPTTETPGANGAKVNEFIDLLLTDWFDRAEKDRLLEGLKLVDVDSCKKYGHNFVDCTPAQQTELMKQMDEGAMAFARSHRVPRQGGKTEASDNFFYTFKRFTLVGYYSSEIGFKQELGKTIIPPGHSGCAPVPEVRS